MQKHRKQLVSPSVANTITLEANKLDLFNCYNTNGTLPQVSGCSAVFCGSNRTNMYSDIVSYTTIKAQETMALQAAATVNSRTSPAQGKTNLPYLQLTTQQNTSPTSLASFFQKQAKHGTPTSSRRRYRDFSSGNLYSPLNHRSFHGTPFKLSTQASAYWAT